MAAISTFSELKTRVAKTLARPEMVDEVENFIALCEATNRREVRIREQLARVEDEIDGQTIPLPTGFIEMKTMRLLTPTTPVTVRTLQEVDPNDMTRMRQNIAARRLLTPQYPGYYCITDTIEFEIDPTTVGSTNPTAEMLYYKALTALSDDNPSNALLVRAPDVYLYGSLFHASPYLMSDARTPVWEGYYRSGIARMKEEDRRRAGPLVARVQGATP